MSRISELEYEVSKLSFRIDELEYALFKIKNPCPVKILDVISFRYKQYSKVYEDYTVVHIDLLAKPAWQIGVSRAGGPIVHIDLKDIVITKINGEEIDTED